MNQAQVAHMAEGPSGAAEKVHRAAQLDHSAELLAAEQRAKVVEDDTGALREQRAKAAEDEAGALQAHEVAHTAEAADSGGDSSSDSSGDSSGGSSGDTRASATKPAAVAGAAASQTTGAAPRPGAPGGHRDLVLPKVHLWEPSGTVSWEPRGAARVRQVRHGQARAAG